MYTGTVRRDVEPYGRCTECGGRWDVAGGLVRAHLRYRWHAYGGLTAARCPGSDLAPLDDPDLGVVNEPG